MSSAITIRFKQPVDRADWLVFCQQHSIVYSPRTIGRNVFYKGGVQISFGHEIYSELPCDTTPVEYADEIIVSTYWMGDLEAVVSVGLTIMRQWKAVGYRDPELRYIWKRAYRQAKGGV